MPQLVRLTPLHPAFAEVTFHGDPPPESLWNALLSDAPEGFTTNLADTLKEAADPGRVLVRLHHWLEAVDDRAIRLELIAREPRFCRLLCRIFDHSQFLTDIISRKPEYMTWLWVESEIDPRWRRIDILGELRAHIHTHPTFARKCESMRRFHRREILRIGVRDIFAHAPLEDVTRDLSDLADAMLQAAIEAAEPEVIERYGTPRHVGGGIEASSAVIAMGKLGGRELNFSSDIDLIFLYSDEGETDQGVSNTEFYTKLGERVIKALADNTAEGHIFRVDMRLRPHGRMGPLAKSLASTIDYFAEHARPWERQALIKARPAAGDLELGELFVKTMRPVVYPRYFDDETLEDIRDTKRQMEEQVAGRGDTEREVKLGRGGIRDIEFTVQMLQMLNGGRNEHLRTPNTLEAIQALGRHGLLSPFDAQTLASNYTFLRHVEHRLQIEGSQQQHALPKDSGVLDDFARRFGYESGAAFLTTYRDRQAETRAILDQFFATEGAGNLWIVKLLNPRDTDPEGLERLKNMGFADPGGAREELLDLYLGPDARPHSSHVRQTFREVAPMLLDAFSKVPNPDDTLMRIGQILTNIKAPSALYDILRHNPGLCETLVALVSNSNYLAGLITRNPALFETFGHAGALDEPLTLESLANEFALLQRAQDPRAALYRLKHAQILRAGMRELMEKADGAAVGHELTLLAEFCLVHALGEARQAVEERHGPANLHFAVIAFGKMAGYEMGYGSDLDLVFVYAEQPGESPISPAEYAAAIASTLIKRLKESTVHGILYDVDTRLRPDGQRGPLAVNLERFEDYYRHHAQAWERLALVKARPVAGDPELHARLEQSIANLAFENPLNREELENIEEIRQRLAANAPPGDIKKGEGGMAELEFAPRLLQIRHAAGIPELIRGDVLGALEVLESNQIIPENDAQALKDAYLFLRRLENRMRMMEGRGESVIPADPDAQAHLARRLGIEGKLDELVQEHRARVHEIYQRVHDSLIREAS